MARKKKEVVKSLATHEETVEAFINHCYRDGEAMAIRPRFGELHIFVVGGDSYLFTEEVLADVIESGKVKMTFRNEKECNLRGLVEIES